MAATVSMLLHIQNISYLLVLERDNPSILLLGGELIDKFHFRMSGSVHYLVLLGIHDMQQASRKAEPGDYKTCSE